MSAQVDERPTGEVSVPNDVSSIAVPPQRVLTSKSKRASVEDLPSGIAVRPGKPTSKRQRTRARRAYKWFVGTLAVLLIRLVSLLPWRAAGALGRLGGRLAWWLRPADRRLATDNVGIAFPEKSEAERRAIARESFSRAGRNAMQWIAVRRVERRIPEIVEITGREHLEAALARKKGLLWVTAHTGNWELMAAATARAGYTCHVIATTVRYEAINRWTIEWRAKRGVKTIERESPTSGRDLLRAMRNNELIGILADHDTKVPSVQVEFFGRPAWTAIGVGELAARLGSAIVTGFPYEVAPGRWRVDVAPPILPPDDVPKKDQLRVARDITQEFTKRTEAHIRAHPEDWAWMHRRWK